MSKGVRLTVKAVRWAPFFLYKKERMKDMLKEGEIRIPSGCAIAAVISKDGNMMTGEKIFKSMIPMHDRSNGLGGGFAGYGIYPEYKDFFALHLFFDDNLILLL